MSTVYTPLGYCTEEDIEDFLLLDIDNSFSPQINTWISAAERWVNNYLGYTTASGILAEEFVNSIEDTATIDSEGNLVIFPRKTPIISVSGIALIKGSSSIDLILCDDNLQNKFDIPEDSDMIVYPGFELSMTGSSVIQSFMDIRNFKFYTSLTYIAGYTEIPPDIHMATVNVASDYIMRHENKEGVQSVSQGAISKSWFQRTGGESDFMVDAKLLLNPYRISSAWIRR